MIIFPGTRSNSHKKIGKGWNDRYGSSRRSCGGIWWSGGAGIGHGRQADDEEVTTDSFDIVI